MFAESWKTIIIHGIVMQFLGFSDILEDDNYVTTNTGLTTPP